MANLLDATTISGVTDQVKNNIVNSSFGQSIGLTPTTPNIAKGQFPAMYDWFYNNLLTTVNSIPIKPLWVLFFDKWPYDAILALGIKSSIENWPDYFASYPAKMKNQGGQGSYAAIFAQGVELVGEKTQINKEGYQQSGLLFGYYANGRESLPTLRVTFLETNYSFTDYVLRPWSVLVGHLGLKNSTLKNGITVFHLAKTPKGFILRKQFSFKGVVPTSIDSEQYTYEGSTIIQRQVEFAFVNYSLQEGAEIEAESLFSSMTQRFLGQFTMNNLFNKTVGAAIDAAGTAGDVLVTNLAGTVNDTVNSYVTQAQSEVLNAANRVTGSIDGAVNDAVNDLTNFNADRDTPQFPNANSGGNIDGAIADGASLAVNPDDTPQMPINFNPQVIGVNDFLRDTSQIPNQAKTIEINDITNFAVGELSMNSLADQPMQVLKQIEINKDDEPNINSIPVQIVTINKDDTPNFVQLPISLKPSKKDDEDTPNSLNIPVQLVTINEDDHL
jgi:hypothetical protein